LPSNLDQLTVRQNLQMLGYGWPGDLEMRRYIPGGKLIVMKQAQYIPTSWFGYCPQGLFDHGSMLVRAYGNVNRLAFSGVSKWEHML